MNSEDGNLDNCEPQSEMDKLYAEAEAKYQKALELEKSMRQGYDAIEIGGIEVLESHTSPEGIKFDVKETLQLMIDYFADSDREEYEKCALLHDILINL